MSGVYRRHYIQHRKTPGPVLFFEVYIKTLNTTVSNKTVVCYQLTESTRKLSNFNFQYTKIITLHQDILSHIALSFILIRRAINKNSYLQIISWLQTISYWEPEKNNFQISQELGKHKKNFLRKNLTLLKFVCSGSHQNFFCVLLHITY